MIKYIFSMLLFCGSIYTNAQQMNKLTDAERKVIIGKGTEAPYTGKFTDATAGGLYTCKQCDAPLYRSQDKFVSSCGWPSFDDEIDGAVTRTPDADGRRTEITCTRCGGHLGHIFAGEGLTPKNVRHCVNSISMNFVPTEDLDTAVFAGGCFWGVEHLMQKQSGVLSVTSGYSGGSIANPTYKQVCSGNTGHIECVEVVFNTKKVNYETLAKLFFEIHDPTQVGGQGPDMGSQYVSAVFYNSPQQRIEAQKLIDTLKIKGYKVATKLTPLQKFYPAEDYHQDYYNKKGSQPYCHAYTKRF